MTPEREAGTTFRHAPSSLRCASIALLSLLGAACHDARPVREIGAPRDYVPSTKHDLVPMDSTTRFGLREMPGTGTGGDQAGGAGYTYELPPGWTKLAPTDIRLVNLQAGGAECYVSDIKGGLMADNVNRWRKQMGVPALTAQEVDALPRKPMLGGSAVLVEATGTFSGMGDTAPKPDYGLLGLVLDKAGNSVSVKMVGPKAIVEAERANFDRFSASLARGAATHASATEPPPATASGTEETLPLKWTEPEGWTRGEERMMRTVTLYPAGNKDAECAVYVFVRPSGGDELGNFTRWYQQMGQPFTPQDLAKLPSLKVLGQPSKLAKIHGTYTSMDGTTSNDATMLALFCELPKHVVCVKLTGPTALVDKEEQHFRAFVESLTKEAQ